MVFDDVNLKVKLIFVDLYVVSFIFYTAFVLVHSHMIFRLLYVFIGQVHTNDGGSPVLGNLFTSINVLCTYLQLHFQKKATKAQKNGELHHCYIFVDCSAQVPDGHVNRAHSVFHVFPACGPDPPVKYAWLNNENVQYGELDSTVSDPHKFIQQSKSYESYSDPFS